MSNYIIFGRNKDNDYILIHSYMGNIDILEERYGSVLLKSREKNMQVDSGKIPEEIYNELVKKHYLVEDKKKDKESYIKVAHKIKKFNQERKITYTLMPSYDCNFRCSYCFELSVVGKNDNKKRMSKSLVDFIFKDVDKNIEKHKKVSILLFGGEPFLKENKDINKYIAECALKRKIKLSAISNGYELDSYLELFQKGYFKTIQITLDGDEEVHNNRRYRIGKRPTFNKIVENIDKVLKIENGPNVTVRINVDKHNYNSVKNVYELIKDMDWINNKKFNFYTKSVHACYADSEERVFDSDVIKNVRLSENNLENMNFNVTYRRMINNIKAVFDENRKIGNLKTGVCSAVNNMKVIDAYGDIYACYEKVCSPNDRIGYIDRESGIFKYNEKRNLWLNRHVQNLDKCSECCYSLICGGNCAEHGKVFTGDLYSPCCEDFKKIFNKVLLEIAPGMNEE